MPDVMSCITAAEVAPAFADPVIVTEKIRSLLPEPGAPTNEVTVVTCPSVV
jgi:hypothetical protein